MTPDEIAALPYRPNVGVMLVNAAGRIFTAQRRDRPAGTDAWQMPQGGIDPGEDPRAAALRELEEETSVRANLVEVLGETQDWITYDLPLELVPKLWGGKWRGQTQKWFLMRFQGTDADINIFTDEPEFTEWRWSAPETLVPDIVPFKRDVYAQVLAAFRSHL